MIGRFIGCQAFMTRGGVPLTFSQLGFGGAPLGNLNCVLTDDEAAAVVNAAWDAGIRYFDTAPLYGHGLSEMRLGRALSRDRLKKVLLSTKVGRLLEPCKVGEEGGGIFRAIPPARVRFDYTRAGILKSYEASCKRLGVDTVDVLFVHDIERQTHGSKGASLALLQLIEGGGWGALEELRRSGDVKAVGLGVNESEACERFLDVAEPDLFLLAGRYTLLEQGALQTLLPACQKRGVGVIVGGPFNSGVLAKSQGTYDYGKAPPQVLHKVARLKQICREHDVSPIAAALRFPLAHPAVTCVVAGAETVEEVRTNSEAFCEQISDGLWQTLKEEGLLDPVAPTPVAKALSC